MVEWLEMIVMILIEWTPKKGMNSLLLLLREYSVRRPGAEVPSAES